MSKPVMLLLASSATILTNRQNILKSAALLLFTFFAFSSSAQLKFKNSGWNSLSVAVGYYDISNGWTTKGWYSLQPGEEKDLLRMNVFGNPNYYYCAIINKCDRGYYGNTKMYVDLANSFSFPDAVKPRQLMTASIKQYGFINLNLKGLTTYTVELKPINLVCSERKQGKWHLALDKEGDNAEKKEDAVFTREITFDAGRPLGWCKDFYPNGNIKAEFKLLTYSPLVYDGKCTWYKEDGSIEKEIVYKNGAIVNELLVNAYGQASNRKAKLEVVELPVQNFYLNSTSNESWKGGSSKTAFFANLPENTVEWYYEFTASRNQHVTAANKSMFTAASKLTSLIDKTGLVSGALGILTAPPGGDICNVYVLDGNYFTEFKTDADQPYHLEVSRTNFKSGIVQVKNMKIAQPIIGIKNNDFSEGIHVSIQIVAVISKLE